jgi:NAD(P)H-hydrate epimerase
MVMDADALNILAENPTWLPFLPANTILTPHPGEFKRLLGVSSLDDDYLERLVDFSRKNGVITVLKDSISTVAVPSGELYFFDVGSAALASAGSGDVLTGVILGLLSSGYRPLEAALLGVYLHGEAGRIAGELHGLESALARDVIAHLGDAFHTLYGEDYTFPHLF